MPMKSPDVIVLTDQQHAKLIGLVRAPTSPQRLVLRARIVLLAAADTANAVIADELGICLDTARKWRHRWAARPEVGSLTDAHRSGRRRAFTPVQIAQVEAVACSQPASCGEPLSRWSCSALARRVVADGICGQISASTVRRTLAADAIKPWRHRSWIFPRAPDFAAKAAKVLDLYARVWDGQPLHDNEYVVSADEKTSIQARCRCHPTLPPGRARTMRVNHDYQRRGAVAYLAAYDVHRARVSGRCEPTTGIEPFTALVDQVMGQEPYASARRVFWIVDNGSSHRGQAAIDRLAARYPNAVMVHTPVHASWLNQIEIYFSIVQRKVVTPNDFTDTAAIEQRLADFETCYNNTAQPFQWRFTTHNLDELLKRIDQHEQATPNTTPTKAA